MIGLQTARAIVIDDDEREALPIIKALGRLGIGAIYLPGDKLEELPRKPIRGIRLAFVDMKLDIEGPPKQVVGKTIKVLERVLSAEGSPCIIIAWTKHQNYIDEFKMLLNEHLPGLQPGVIKTMEKPPSFDIGRVAKEISSCLDEIWPLEVLFAWEQRAHNAATSTTETISGSVSKHALTGSGNAIDRWKRSTKSVLTAMVRAGGGKTVEGDDAMTTLLECLSSLHLDHLEHEERVLPFQKAGKLLGKSVPNLTASARVDLNSRLLTSGVAAGDRRVRPGNLYLECHEKGKRCPVVRFKITAHDIFSVLEPAWKKDADYSQLNRAQSQNQKSGTRDNTSIEEIAGQLEERKEVIRSECIPAALELSPACDFSQGKQQVARFIGAVLVPSRHKDIFPVKPQHRMYLKSLEGILIPNQVDEYHLILSARLLYSVRNPSRTILVQPRCRLRSQVVSDIQSWFAAHAARPGYLAVR